MPALGMFQDTGKLVSWLKQEGERVAKGEAIMEIETDKATVEVEAQAEGVLRGVRAQPGQDVPVGETIAWILAPGESLPAEAPASQPQPVELAPSAAAQSEASLTGKTSPLARRIAAQHGVDLAQVRPDGGRIQKNDVMAYLQAQESAPMPARLSPASPKARRLAQELGLSLETMQGSGPGGAVLAGDVQSAAERSRQIELPASQEPGEGLPVSATWRVMVERISLAWKEVPHFYLAREANATRLLAWKETAQRRAGLKITVTDLLVRLAASALAQHPRLAARWENGQLLAGKDLNIGVAMAIEDGLVAPVVHQADRKTLRQIGERRLQLVERAQAGRLKPQDLAGGVFTISNLGMYGIDAFNAIVNPPQAAILAVGRIAERVIALNGQPVVQPMMTLTLSCDHRVVDGARGAQFLQALVELIEEPLGLVE
jgi:pyruvate dehydrogenase E2 component (dihydrolipoamide acetyltransferase)